jgi:hypothetical protein
MQKLKKILHLFLGFDLKTLVFLVLLIYWAIIIVEDACLKVPKLYEGSCIRKLAACGLKLEPKFVGYESCSRFLEALGA